MTHSNHWTVDHRPSVSIISKSFHHCKGFWRWKALGYFCLLYLIFYVVEIEPHHVTRDTTESKVAGGCTKWSSSPWYSSEHHSTEDQKFQQFFYFSYNPSQFSLGCTFIRCLNASKPKPPCSTGPVPRSTTLFCWERWFGVLASQSSGAGSSLLKPSCSEGQHFTGLCRLPDWSFLQIHLLMQHYLHKYQQKRVR